MTKIWQSPISLEILTARNQNTMSDFLGIKFIELGDNFIKACMPITERTRQPLGIMHGGASCVLAETVGSIAANYCVNLESFYCVGLDINTNHIRSIREGYAFAIAKPFHLGRSTQVWSIEVTNAEEQLISVNRLTMAVLPRKKS